MGKTEKGAIWLNERLFSSYDYWQFWRNTDDRDVKRFLNFFKPNEMILLISLSLQLFRSITFIDTKTLEISFP